MWRSACAAGSLLVAELDADVDCTRLAGDPRPGQIADWINSAMELGRTTFGHPGIFDARWANHSETEGFRAAFDRWKRREFARRNRLEAERVAAERVSAIATWRRVTVDRADITEHVAAMFDALINSTDWGSAWLDTETIESILIVGEVVGFDTSAVQLAEDHSLRMTISAWRAQVKARAAAMLQESK